MSDYRNRNRENPSDWQRGLKDSKHDDPPNSRLFIVCGRTLSEEDFREGFSKFGSIEEIWMVKDKVSGEPKGVTYIKFSKTSEAALAMEEMNGRCIGGHPRPLKVMIAHSRDQGSKREVNEDERLLRLFVVVPKTMIESELREHFSQFGDIDYVTIVKDRNTKESKGFAYVKYHRMSHSAKAYEQCDRSFKPVFADPKPQHQGGTSSYGGGGGGGGHMPPPDMGRSDSFSGGIPSSASSSAAAYDMLGFNDGMTDYSTRLTVLASPCLNQEQLWKLFDIIPGLEYCDLTRRKAGQSRGVALVVYNNPQSANYAKDKLHGFEYPPGERIIVKFDGPYGPDIPGRPPHMGPPVGFVGHRNGPGPSSPYAPPPRPLPPMPPSNANQQPPNHRPNNIQNDLATLAETIAQATSLIQAAGLGIGQSSSGNPTPNPTSVSPNETYDPSYCSVRLPTPQPLAPIDSAVAERLFIVCQPTPPPIYAMKDVFGRFGNLIDVYMLAGKCCGYAKYAKKESAERAIVTLHGQEVCEKRLKVMMADPQERQDSSRKRFRADETVGKPEPRI